MSRIETIFSKVSTMTHSFEEFSPDRMQEKNSDVVCIPDFLKYDMEDYIFILPLWYTYLSVNGSEYMWNISIHSTSSDRETRKNVKTE
jgi:hypothetical protein